MQAHKFPAVLRPAALPLAVAACLWLTACGSGIDEPTEQAQGLAAGADARAAPLRARAPATIPATATANTLLVGIKLAGYPHKVDVYRPAGATKAIVFLHGQGGTTWKLAYDLGFNRVNAPQSAKNVNWDWLSRNGIIAVFAQGQALPGTRLPGWNNYVFDSGQDDVAFLSALSTYVRTQFGVSQVALSGHSSGGAMTARMWCEATSAYDEFVSLAGPMASATYPQPGPTCVPQTPAPYFLVIGGKDSKLPMFALGDRTPTPEQIAAGLTDTILTSEWARHQDRGFAVCGETPSLDAAVADATGPTWNACDSRVRFRVVSDADHPIASLEQFAKVRMVDLIAQFMKP